MKLFYMSSFITSNFKYYTGNWLLRSTNNPYYNEGNTRLQIYNDGTLCFRTKQNNYIFNEIRKKNGKYIFDDNNMILNIQFDTIIFYKNSFFGIKTSKFNRRIEECNTIVQLNCTLETYDKLYLYDYINNYHYLYDLYIEELEIPRIETSLNNFIFIQIFSFIINTLLTLSLRNIILDNNF